MTATVRIGVVLAGGRSRRMGRDKAHLRVGGRTLLAHALAAVRGAGLRPVVIGRRSIPDDPQVDCHADDAPDGGPASGLRTAARLYPQEPLLALACDMPGLTSEVLGELLVAWQDAGYPSAAGWTDTGGLHPLPGIYTPRALARLTPGGGLWQAFSADALRLPLADSRQDALRDCDTPQDLERG